jgi:hypothetical protein
LYKWQPELQIEQGNYLPDKKQVKQEKLYCKSGGKSCFSYPGTEKIIIFLIPDFLLFIVNILNVMMKVNNLTKIQSMMFIRLLFNHVITLLY